MLRCSSITTRAAKSKMKFAVVLTVILPGVLSRLTESPSHSGSCKRPNQTELEVIIADSFSLLDGVTRPTIRLLEYKIVCESAGIIKDTLSSFSAVVYFECSGSLIEDCTVAPINLTSQIQSSCNPHKTFSSSSSRTANPQADLTTPLNDFCGLYAEPTDFILSDPVNHCWGTPAKLKTSKRDPLRKGLPSNKGHHISGPLPSSFLTRRATQLRTKWLSIPLVDLHQYHLIL